MELTFHGVRGSTPCHGHEIARYGGNTSCVSLAIPGHDPILFDLGTGQDRPVEFYNAALDERGLQNIAAQTNGRYYPLSKLGDIPDDAVYVEGESSFVEQKELWDVPFLFLLLCGSLAGECGSWQRQVATEH